jgi:FkbM family methyltransferase
MTNENITIMNNSTFPVYQFVRFIGLHWHKFISKSKILTKIYINLLSVLIRKIPSQKIKQMIMNSINAVKWQDDVELKPIQIQLGSSTEIKIFPHFYEFDLGAIFNYKLNYENEVFNYLETRIKNYDHIIEIGANVGIFSLFFADKFRSMGKDDNNRYVFEPSRKAYQRLVKNIAINNFKIQAFNLAIGNESKFTNFYEPEGHLTNGSLLSDFAEIFSKNIEINQTLMIEGQILEGLINKSGQNFLIKIDVEGAEKFVLEGLKNLIISKKPDLMIEVLSIFEEELNNISFLKENYNFFNITEEGLIKQEKLIGTSFRDYILIHK